MPRTGEPTAQCCCARPLLLGTAEKPAIGAAAGIAISEANKQGETAA